MQLENLLNAYIVSGNLEGARRVARIGFQRELTEDELVAIIERITPSLINNANISEHEEILFEYFNQDLRKFNQICALLSVGQKDLQIINLIEKLLAQDQIEDDLLKNTCNLAENISSESRFKNEAYGYICHIALLHGWHNYAVYAAQKCDRVLSLKERLACLQIRYHYSEDIAMKGLLTAISQHKRINAVKGAVLILIERGFLDNAYSLVIEYLTGNDKKRYLILLSKRYSKAGLSCYKELLENLKDLDYTPPLQEKIEWLDNYLGHQCRYFTDGGAHIIKSILPSEQQSDYFVKLAYIFFKNASFGAAVGLLLNVPDKTKRNKYLEDLAFGLFKLSEESHDHRLAFRYAVEARKYFPRVRATLRFWVLFNKLFEKNQYFCEEQALALFEFLPENRKSTAIKMIISALARDKDDLSSRGLYWKLVDQLPVEEAEKYRQCLGLTPLAI